MPTYKQDVAFGMQTDYALEERKLERQRKMAEALQAQSMAPSGGTEMVGGWAIPKSPMEGLGKAAQGISAAYQMRAADDSEKQLVAKKNQEMSDWASQDPSIQSPRQPIQVAMNGGGGYEIPQVQDTPQETSKARLAWALRGAQMQNPIAQAMGMSAMQDEQRQQRVARLVGGLTGGTQQTSSGGQPGTIMGVPAQLAAALLDPDLKALGTAGMDLYKQSQQPVINRGFGVGQMVNGKYVPDQASQDQALALKRGEGDIAAERDLVKVTNSDNTTSYIPRSQLIQGAQPGQPPIPQQGAPVPQQTQGIQAGTFGPGALQDIAKLIQQNPQEGAQALQSFLMAQQGKSGSGGAAGAPQSMPQGVTPPTAQIPPQPAIPGQPIPASAVMGGPPRFGQSQEQAIAGDAQKAQAVDEAKKRGELTFDAPQARSNVSDMSANLDRLKAEAQKISSDPALSRVTGLMNYIPNVRGSKASDVEARLGALKSQVGFSVLQAMRNASKTGGALGNISDAEGKRLEANLAALDQSQSPEAFRENLKQIIDYVDGAKQRVESAYRDQYERVQGTQGMTPSSQGAKPVRTQIIPQQSSTGVVSWGNLK